MLAKSRYRAVENHYSVNELTCRNGERIILDSISFDFYKNRTLVILGPGGSGKSTLLNILSRNSTEPFLVKNNNSLLNKKDVGYMTQHNMYLQNSFKEISQDLNVGLENSILSEWTNIDLIKKMVHYSKALKTEMPRSLFKLFEYTLFAARERRKNVWLLDEPDVGLNENLDFLIENIKSYKRNKTIVMVTHNVRLALEIADDIMYLAYGRIVEHSPVKDFYNSSNPDVKYLLKMGC